MTKCSFRGCRRKSEDGITLFVITKKRRGEWLRILNLPPSTGPKARICEGHFTLDQFEPTSLSMGKLELRPGAKPTNLTPNATSPVERQLVCEVVQCTTNYVNGTSTFELQPSAVKLVPRVPFKDISSHSNIAHSFPPPVPASASNIMEEDQENRIKRLEAENLRLRLQLDKRPLLPENINKVFTNDQLKLLELDSFSQNVREWKPVSIKKAMRIRLACKAKGYEDLRKEHHYPLPSLVTLNRRLMNVNLIPGKFCVMIKWLDHKITSEKLPLMARYCILSFDEMVTKLRVEYDQGLKCYLGFVSSEIAKDEDEKLTKASHCLAFVLRGLTTHWKQLLTYLLTGSSVDPGKLWSFLEEMLMLLSKFNFHVLAVATDMGGGNQALWSLKGIFWSRGRIVPSIPHPAPATFVSAPSPSSSTTYTSASSPASSATFIPAPNPSPSTAFVSTPTPSSSTTSTPKLLFTPDVPHLIKNMWAQLLRTIFLLPASFLDKHQLDSNIVSPHHVREFMDIQGSQGIRPVPNLNENALNPSKFEKMRVPVALAFFSEKLGHALITASDMNLISKAAKTTGIFILSVAKWYSIMSSRSCFDALNKSSHDSINVLKEFMELIGGMKFVRISSKKEDNQWKPIQGGIQLATTVVIDLWEDLVLTDTIEYLLTSRLFTSGCENIFSQARGGGDIHPGPVRLRHTLRLICVAQYLRSPSSASYEDDDEPYYIDFLSLPSDKSEDWTFCDEEVDELLDYSPSALAEIVRQGLYYVAGWVVSKVKGSCSTCDAALLSPSPLPNLPSAFTEAVSKGGLSHPTEMTWAIINVAEDIVRAKTSKILSLNVNIKRLLITCIQKQCAKVSVPKCHNFIQTVAGQYLSLRLHVIAADISTEGGAQKVLFSSASAFMRTAAQNCHGPAQRNAHI